MIRLILLCNFVFFGLMFFGVIPLLTFTHCLVSSFSLSGIIVLGTLLDKEYKKMFGNYFDE